MGGDKFRLRLTLENTSTVTAVQNVRLSFDSGEGAPFLPTDGATTKYIDYIAAGGQYELILDLQASANLEEKIYPLNLKMEYEDYAAKVYNAEETLSLQLHQETRVGISGVEAYPAQLSVGQEGNLTFSILNKGKNKLNNASITFPEGGAVSAPEVFLGNIDPGAAKDVDISIMPENPTNGEKIKIQIHYEDSNGQPKIIEEELSLEVVEAMPPDDMYPPEGEFPGEPGEFPGGDDEGGSKFPIWAWILIILALLIALIAVLTALMRKRRRQKQAEEDAEFFRQLEEERQNRNPGASPKTSPNGQNGHGSKAQNANTPKASNGNGSKSSNGNGSRPGGGSVGPAKSDRQAPRRR